MEDIRLFIWTHPWWHAAAVLIPAIFMCEESATIRRMLHVPHHREHHPLSEMLTPCFA